MNTYECNACNSGTCTCLCRGTTPTQCLHFDTWMPRWRRVETADEVWAVGDWGRYEGLDGCPIYFRVQHTTMIDGKHVLYGVHDPNLPASEMPAHACRKCRVRPYNSKELAKLVGGCVHYKDGRLAASMVLGVSDRDQVAIVVGVDSEGNSKCVWCDASELLEVAEMPDGMPCGVLQHKDLEGNWDDFAGWQLSKKCESV